ncbi:MAG: GAF domain-containing protein, partial [Candidatus Methylumidiphilus sp.]
MRLFSTENVSVDTLNCLMDFYRQLNPTKTAKEAIETFFQQLINISEASTVGLFLKNKQGKLDVSIHGIADPPEEIPLTRSRVLDEYARKTDWSLESYGKEHRQGESQRLFLAEFHCFLVCPLIIGGYNIGVLKFDFCKEPNISEADTNLLELLSERFASHLNQIQQEAALKQQRIDAWFDHVILKIKECWERKKVREVLTSGCSELRNIDASLIKSFRLYMVDPRGEWYYMDIISIGSDRANHEVHYKPSSHLTHFVDSGKDLFLYTQENCISLKLQSFHDHGLKESLCLRTDFRPGLLGLTGMAQESVIVVLWTNAEHFLARHQMEFQRVVQQIESTLFA